MAVAIAAAIGTAKADSTFDLPSQPLADSLRAVASQSRVNVLFDPPLVADHEAPPLKGDYSTHEAFEVLLRDTGIRQNYLNEQTIVLAAARSGSTSALRRIYLAQANNQRQPASTTLAGAEPEVIDEVIVTAQKREERLSDVPISISVVGGEALDSSSFSGVTEVLNNVPGVAVTGYGVPQIAVRGVTAAGSSFAGSSPIAYYVDSVPFGFVRSAIVPDLGAFDLDRIEVLRGPQGTLYGASALNGVVRVLTNDADLNELSFKARASASTTEEGGDNYGGDAALNVPLIEGKLAARAVVGYQDQSGWIDSPVTNDVNDGQLRNYRLKLNASLTEQFSIQASAWQRRDDLGSPSAADDNFRISRPRSESGSNDLDAYGLSARYDAPAFSLTSMTSFVDYSLKVQGDAFAQGLFITEQTAKVFAQEIVLSSRDDAAWRWTAGALYRDAEDLTKQGTQLDSYAAIDNFHDMSESLAIYGEIGRRFANNKWEWTVGLRHFSDDAATQQSLEEPTYPNVPFGPVENSFNSTTPRVVLTWLPNQDLTVYGSYSEGFRSGFPQNELALTAAPGLAPLKPDTLRNYEIGAKGSVGQRVSFDAAVYYIDWEDVQQTTGVPVPGGGPGNFVIAPLNGDSASGVGVDLGLTLMPIDALSLGLSVSWNDLTMDEPVFSFGGLLYEKGDRLNQSPEYTASGTAEYSFALGSNGYQANFLATATYTSEMLTSAVFGGATVLEPGDPMLISRLRFTVEAPRHWSAAIFADNLNDERGSQMITVPGFAEYDVRVRPRTVGVQLEYRF
jgi:iron complex outermembrane recepter protein